MTKKDYSVIAAKLRGQMITGAPATSLHAIEFCRGANEQAQNYIFGLADIFADDNPRFNRVKFLEACGVK